MLFKKGEDRERRVTDLEINVARIATKMGLFAAIGAVVGTAVVQFLFAFLKPH